MSLTANILVVRNDRVMHGDIMGIGEELRRCCRHCEIDCSYGRVRFQELDDGGCSLSDEMTHDHESIKLVMLTAAHDHPFPLVLPLSPTSKWLFSAKLLSQSEQAFRMLLLLPPFSDNVDRIINSSNRCSNFSILSTSCTNIIPCTTINLRFS